MVVSVETEERKIVLREPTVHDKLVSSFEGKLKFIQQEDKSLSERYPGRKPYDDRVIIGFAMYQFLLPVNLDRQGLRRNDSDYRDNCKRLAEYLVSDPERANVISHWIEDNKKSDIIEDPRARRIIAEMKKQIKTKENVRNL